MPGVCFAYQKGECDRGSSCRFAHGDGDANEGGGRSRGVCFAFQRGECDRGESCRFAHEGGDGGAFASSRAPRDRSSRPPRSSSGPSGGARGMCFAFQKGECDRGESCRFAHGEEDMYSARPPPKSRGVCFAYQKGECDRGESCRFAHEAGDA